MNVCKKIKLSKQEAERRAREVRKFQGKRFIAYKCPYCGSFHNANATDYGAPKSKPYVREQKHGVWR